VPRLPVAPDLDIVDAATRREFLAMLAAAGLLAACGDGGGGDGAAPGGATRPFVDETGATIQVPDRPRRIVAIHDINAGGQLLSLGAPVVGISSRDDGFRRDITRYFDLDGVADVGLTYEPNLEAIAALEPDLIVGEGFDGGGMGFDQSLQSSLEAIAPVVYIDTFRPVEEVMADFAELLGGGAVARFDQQKAELDGKVAELRAILGDRWDEVTASLIALNVNGLEAWGPTSLPELDLLTRVGAGWVPLQIEADQDPNGGYIGGISTERLPEFSADLIVVQTAYGAEILDDPLYQALPAVQRGQVIEMAEPTAGSHFTNYRYVAGLLIDVLQSMTIDTTIVS
jgi:iron complex transport system substrate-binding protein